VRSAPGRTPADRKHEGSSVMTQQLEDTDKMRDDPMPLLGIDHVENYVGNARQAAHYYSKVRVPHHRVQRAGDGVRDRASYVIEQNHARHVFTGAIGPESPITKHARGRREGRGAARSEREIRLGLRDQAGARRACSSRRSSRAPEDGGGCRHGRETGARAR
jgi:hypothetical protein